jgi:hypothetical protein
MTKQSWYNQKYIDYTLFYLLGNNSSVQTQALDENKQYYSENGQYSSNYTLESYRNIEYPLFFNLILVDVEPDTSTTNIQYNHTWTLIVPETDIEIHSTESTVICQLKNQT